MTCSQRAAPVVSSAARTRGTAPCRRVGGLTKRSPLTAFPCRRLLDGVSGIKPITKFNASEFPTRFAGQIDNFDLEG